MIENKAKIESEEVGKRLHNPDTLIKLASTANLLAWLFLILVVLRSITLLVEPALINMGELLFYDLRMILLFPSLFSFDPLTNFAQGAIFFVVLRTISEGIYLLLDIEVNTREILEELKKRKE